MKRTVITILVACLGIMGCVPIIPANVPLARHDLLPIFSKEPITLVNAQEVNENTIIFFKDINLRNRELETNFHDWTSQALVLIRQWLNKYRIPIVENSQKTLTVSISNAKIEQRGFACTILTLNVQTGNGIKKHYSVDACASGMDRSVGYAINWAVIELINDGDILRYITDK